ncbi:hypothetical protein CEUSTIGMA_g4566.t1 [Chlamydomonas eustigma]|uniref:RING-type domain-containing protein n=1 Tax=Chlamydomonas eustigma TaxID=1157962 RepID=A0A250X2X7_9CHLO|nr:hypothetical protein CEUSTIGMA_g4566.t1 [Chlamydomonas eustigma]|eukprot:GAX77120.1 hypothetical protein CEUSTIGMA_g4566.t1 [Chlamydomonas eustigma]
MGRLRKHGLEEHEEPINNGLLFRHQDQEVESVTVDLSQLNEETKCPICFGKIKKARVSIVCGHRYCGDCIDHCMRLEIPGRRPEVRECPVCRAHMPSRRSAKEDPNFDFLLRALYGDVTEYEQQEEVVMQEELKQHQGALAQEMEHMRTTKAHQIAAAQAYRVTKKRRT